MSWHIVSDVYKAKLGGPTRKAIAAKLADWADDDGGSIFPSVQRIADETETSTRTVQYVLREFVSEGLLKVDRVGGKGAGSTTTYRFCLDNLSSRPRSRTLIKGATVAPLTKRGRVQSTTNKGATDSNKGATVAPEPLEPKRTQFKATSSFQKEKSVSRTVRNTDEPWDAYVARMVREGKYKPDPKHARD